MNYRVREGIILRNICDEWLLIAVGVASQHCMYVRQVNETLAFYWTLIEKGKSKKEIVQAAMDNFEVSEEQAEQDIENLISQLVKMNYLIPVAGSVS